MRIIKYNKATTQFEYTQYPRVDMEAIPGLDPDIQYYIDESTHYTGEVNIRTHRVIGHHVFTDDIHPEYPAFKIHILSYELIQLADEDIISMLSDYVGSLIESVYPVWKQIKYLDKKTNLKVDNLTDAEQKELLYYTDVFDWINIIRDERDAQEAGLVNSRILPSYIFSKAPLRTDTKYQ